MDSTDVAVHLNTHKCLNTAHEITILTTSEPVVKRGKTNKKKKVIFRNDLTLQLL